MALFARGLPAPTGFVKWNIETCPEERQNRNQAGSLTDVAQDGQVFHHNRRVYRKRCRCGTWRSGRKGSRGPGHSAILAQSSCGAKLGSSLWARCVPPISTSPQPWTKCWCQSMHALIGQLLSEATLLGYIAQLHHALAQWERQAIERLLAQPAMHVDETSLRVDRKNHWIHVYSAGTLTVKRLHPKRGCEAIEDIGIIPRYGGVAVHDCWASYLSYTNCEHALCGSHLLRELTFIVEAHNYAWAKRMKRLLLDACHEVAKRDEKRLSESEYKAVQKRYRTILTQGERELPPIPPRQKGQRGKVAKSDAHNLWERMKKYEKAVLRFAKHPDVAFTNNRAERDLRMSKVKQKVSGCFRTRKYAEAYCRISSYLQSMANQGYNPLVAIQIALAGRAVDNLPE